jgi:hypothetical protein
MEEGKLDPESSIFVALHKAQEIIDTHIPLTQWLVGVWEFWFASWNSEGGGTA